MPKPTKPIEFAHCADLHLGYKQYGLQDRFIDFFLAFDQVIDYVIKNNIPLLIIPGDIFDKKELSPETLNLTITRLQMLKQNNIAVIATEGNHDRKQRINNMSWLEYLENEGYIKLLSDSFVTFKNLKIVGMDYHGALTKQALENLECDGDILMLHAGVVGQVPNSGNISSKDLLNLRPRFKYIALGHIHKPYVIDDFIFNPGSTESHAINEYDFEGGFFHVKMNGDKISYDHIITNKRQVVRRAYENDQILKGISLEDIDEEAIVEISITGEMKEKPNFEKIKAGIEGDVFHIRLIDKTTRENQTLEFSNLDRVEIEKKVISDLAGDDRLAQMIYDLKNEENVDPELVFDRFYNMVGE